MTNVLPVGDAAEALANTVYHNFFSCYEYKELIHPLLSRTDAVAIGEQVAEVALAYFQENFPAGVPQAEISYFAGGFEYPEGQFNVVTGQGVRSSGLTKLYYDATKAAIGQTLAAFFSIGACSSGYEAPALLYAVLPKVDEVKRVLVAMRAFADQYVNSIGSANPPAYAL